MHSAMRDAPLKYRKFQFSDMDNGRLETKYALRHIMTIISILSKKMRFLIFATLTTDTINNIATTPTEKFLVISKRLNAKNISKAESSSFLLIVLKNVIFIRVMFCEFGNVCFH